MLGSALGMLAVFYLALEVALIKTVGEGDHFFVAFAEKTDLVDHSGEELGCVGASAEAKDVDLCVLYHVNWGSWASGCETYSFIVTHEKAVASNDMSVKSGAKALINCL